MVPFSRASLRAAFRELSRELWRTRVKAHVYVVGGAAVAFGFDERRQTMDVDALITAGHGPVTDAVRRPPEGRGRHCLPRPAPGAVVGPGGLRPT